MVGLRLVVALVLLHIFMAPAKSDVMCGRQYSSVQDLAIGLMTATKNQAHYEDNQVVTFVDKENSAVFVFAKRAHPAYPAVACRTPEKHQDEFRIRTEVRCASSKPICDAFVRELTSSNNR